MTAQSTIVSPPETPSQETAPRPAPDRKPHGPTRVAIVGAGFIAEFHLDILAAVPDVEVVAVCDPSLERARSAARRHGIPAAVGSVAELAEHRVDVAHVLVPPPFHGAVARELLALGIGLFVEKPLVPSSEEARELAAEAERRGLILGANHNALHHPAFRDVLAQVRAGSIGRVEHVRATLSVPLRQLDAGDFAHWMFRAPRNIVFEQAPHPLAQVHALIGRVRSAQTTLLKSRELLPGQVFHERWLVAARGERGTAEVYLAFGQDFTRSEIEVLGSDGALSADLHHGLVQREDKTQFLDFWNSFLAGWRRGKGLRRSALKGLYYYGRQTLGLGRREDAFFAGMRGSIEGFHAAFRAGARPPSDGRDAVEVLEWCEAAAEGVPGESGDAPKLPAPGPVREGEIVVLGGTGFIGRRVVAGLLKEGAPVTCSVRRAHSLPPIVTEAAEAGRVRLVRADLEDPVALREAIGGARCVVHLATGGGASWEAIEKSMVGGTRAVGEACLDLGVERLVYVSSTAALYLGEDAGREIDDDVGPDPQPAARALYARGKIAAENELFRLANERGLKMTIARPGVVLGEGTPMQHSGLGLWVRDNHCVGWGPGDNALPLVWVDDVADALVRAALHPGKELDGVAFNLCASPPLTAREVVAELVKSSGRRLDFHPRALGLSQTMEIGKWLVKVAGRRPGAEFPSWRDLKSRALVPAIPSRRAREVLGWKPVEDREAFLDRAVRIHAP